MPRAESYYDNRLNQLNSATPQPTAPAPAEADTQRQLYQKINNTTAAAETEYYKNEANRSVLSRLPYEFYSTIYNMPEEKEWQNYNFFQKGLHINVENLKLVGKMITTLPREILKAPLRLEQSFYDMTVKAIAAMDPNANSEKVMRTLGRGRSYSLPWLGEVKGVAGGYQEGKSLGLSPFMSAVKATGELAGDLAVAASLTEAGAAAFKPRLSQVKGTPSIYGDDFRPLTAEQTAKIKTAGSEGQMVKGEVLTPKQNPNVTYIRVPKSAAAQFGGNSNNTFLKITPLGEGTAEYSVVQLRKSLVDTTKDFFKEKFGRSAVTEGPFGPELKLQSGTVNYNPYALVKKGDAGVPMTKSAFEINKPVLPSATEAAAAKTAASTPATLSEAYQFYSPNIEESLSFEEAAKRLTSGDQARYKSIGQDIDTQLGHESQSFSAIGDWSDGAENTVFNIIKNPKSFDELKYSAAIKGKIGNQKAVIPFMAEEGGADSLYMAEIKGVPLEELRPKLDELGIQFRTLVKTKDGVKVVVFDQGSALTEQLNKLGETYDTNIEQIKGRGEFLGSFNTRAEGLSEYNKVISGYEQTPGGRYYQPAQGGRVPDTVSQEAKSIDPFLRQKVEMPSSMAKPIKGFENSMVTEKQVNQVLDLKADKELSDITLQAISKVVTGKNNIYDLTQKEAYDVSEAMRLMPGEGTIAGGDWQFFMRPWTHPARYWMEAAEREIGVPVYSEVFLPIETGGRLMNVFSERWQDAARNAFGKYAKPNYVEERRAITDYIEGNKKSITENPALDEKTKADLLIIGDWLQEQYKLLFKDIGISSERFFGYYSPKIRKLGGINQLYKSDELPLEIKPFYEFEREGDLAPLEDDALALFDIYTRAVGKKTYMHDPLENAKKIVEKMDDGSVKRSTNAYLQEKLGYAGKGEEYLNKVGESLSQKTSGFIPKDITKQLFDTAMTTSYAGALGLPRVMPIFRNAIQVLLTTYPDLGPQFFAEGVKRFFAEGGLQKVKDKGFLVKMGVPYGAELSAETGRGVIGRSVDLYKNLNQFTMKPYGWTDELTRGVTYHGVEARFENYWQAFRDGKIDYTEFERGINMDGFNPTLQKVLRQKFGQNTPEALEEAKDLMAMDILDSTQFPYRKGSESRIFYGLKGKAGLQFGQWTAEYVFTLKSWIARGQWQKLIRWMGMGSAVKRSVEDTFNIDVSKWVNAPEDIIMGIFGGGNIGAAGPFSGFPLGPIGKMTASAIAGFNSAMTGMTDEVNKHWQDIFRSMQIYGGVLTGVGATKIKDFTQSIKRYEAGMAVSPDPAKPFGIWSSTGKIIRWVDFTTLTKVLLGFDDPEGYEQSERIGRIKKESVEYTNHINQAMNFLVDGNFKKFDQTVQKYNLLIPDLASKMKSYQTPLDQRIFEQMPMELKVKYFNAFYPANGQ